MDSNSEIEYWYSLDESMWSQSLSKAVVFHGFGGNQECANEVRGRILDSTFCGTCLQQLVGHGHCLNDLTKSYPTPHPLQTLWPHRPLKVECFTVTHCFSVFQFQFDAHGGILTIKETVSFKIKDFVQGTSCSAVRGDRCIMLVTALCSRLDITRPCVLFATVGMQY